MEKTDAFKMLMKNLSYFDRILNRYQSLPRWYGPDLLLYSSEAELLEAIGGRGAHHRHRAGPDEGLHPPAPSLRP